MPSPLKYHPHGAVLFITFSLEEGLFLLANPLCLAIVKSCLARALHLHPITISHLLVNATHLHLVVVVQNPADVPAFMSRFKTESAHMFNRLLGRRKRTFWCEGYDSPIVLSKARTMLSIAYLYANPAKDNLVHTIDEYPGLSTWQMFQQNRTTVSWKRLRRPAIQKIKRHNLATYQKEAERLLRESKEEHEFTIFPNAWMEAFGITDSVEQDETNKSLVAHIRLLEERAAEKRRREGKSVMGVWRLISQPINPYYQPQRSGKRMWCLGDRKSERAPFIAWLKERVAEAKRIYRKWFLGDFREPYPAGLYPPSMPKLVEPLFAW